jgi:hypothetical protein
MIPVEFVCVQNNPNRKASFVLNGGDQSGLVRGWASLEFDVIFNPTNAASAAFF